MQQIGPYTVLEEIARGGHGVVYRAQAARGQIVALKLLLAHRAQNEQARRRFQAEVNALARLRHPHVVPILAAGKHEGCPWLALEYVEGETLEARLRRGPLAVYEAIRVARQLAQALSYVHSSGVLHRDLKPDNVLLRGNVALLTDFGLVLDDQSSISRITATGIFQGTPGYWAPEQARGEVHAHGPTTDVYGLGAVLYACLTGQPPVSAHSLTEYLQTVRFAATQSPRKVRPEVPEWLSALCMRCLALVPASRPASADEVARALVLAGGATQVRGEGGSKTTLVALAGVVLASGVGLGALGAWALRDVQPEQSVDPAAVSDPQGAAPDPSAAPQSVVRVSPEQTQQPQALLDSANAHLMERRFSEAIADLDEALGLDPRFAKAYALRGQSKADLGRFSAAIKDFDTAIELEPQYSAVYIGRAFSWTELGRHAEAIEDYDRALELGLPQAATRKVGRFRAEAVARLAEQTSDPVLSAEQKQRARAIAASANAKARAGRLDEAIADYGRALELDPSNAAAYTNRGMSLAKLGRHAEAIADYDAAIAAEPRFAVAYGLRGVSKAELGRYPEAFEDHDRAIALNPRDAQSYSNRGHAKGAQGRHAEAVEDYDTALELNPRDPVAHTNRGASLANLGRHAQALEAFDAALELNPRHGMAYVNRGRSKHELGRPAEALADLDRGLGLGVSKVAAERANRWRAEAAAELGGQAGGPEAKLEEQ